MGIRDEEIKRLILYGKSLGGKITVRDYAFEHEGEIVFDPKYVININKRVHNNKTEIIMTLLHELSHLRYVIANNYKFSDAFTDEIWKIEEQDEKVPLKYSKDIAEFELESLELMPVIATELGIKIPSWKILRQKDHDQFMYEYFGNNGVFPDTNTVDVKWKMLTEKYKK